MVSGRIASFCYNGELISLNPAEMNAMGGGVYEKLLPDGLCAVLETAEYGGSAGSVLLRFENRGVANTGRVSRVRSVDIAIPTQQTVWRSFKGDSCGENSFNPLERWLGEGSALHIEPDGGRSSDTSGFPFFDLECDGTAYAFGIGWSGHWMQEVTQFAGACRVEIGLTDADFCLLPGERVRGPRVLCVKEESSASVRRAFRRVMMEHFSPKTRLGQDACLPIALQPFDRYFYNPKVDWYLKGRPDWATEQGQIFSVDAALKCRHMDTLWLDAAWFKDGFPTGVGNYSFEAGFPRGLRPVTDYAHEKGLRFMLWFEPERVDYRSETCRDHREMLLACGSDNLLFNLGDDKALAWLKDTLITFIRENGIDIYRQDFNFNTLPYWRANDQAGRCGITEMKYVAGLYSLWDALLEAFPGLLIDNCASGGRRIDIETCSRAVPLWRSDTGCSPVNEERRMHTWSQNHIMALTQYIPFHGCATWETSAYHVRSAQSGALACNFDVLNEAFDYAQAESVLAEVSAHRKYWAGDFYPLTGISNSEAIWAAYQLSLGDSGVAYAFRRDCCPDSQFTLHMQAVDPDARYEVKLTDEQMHAETYVVSGAELMNLQVCCDQPMQSLSVEYRKAE